MITYIATGCNSISVVQLDDTTGELIKTIETLKNVAPNPDNLEEGAFNGIATEWLCRHPKFPLLYVLTSYWSTRQAYITIFRINQDVIQNEACSSEKSYLTRLGGCDSGGKQAVCGIFSKDASTLVICHHNDGNLSIFDTSQDDVPLPIQVIETPLVQEGTRRIVKGQNPGSPLPSLHHVLYGPNHNYLLTVDIAQDAIFTYRVDAQGRPTSTLPTYQHICQTNSVAPGWWLRLIFNWILGNHTRPRKAAIHPNGKYVYVMHEVSNIIQVYSITPEGKIETECHQEISTLDPSFTQSKICSRPIGLTFNLAGELAIVVANNNEPLLIVSNRGDVFLGRAENTLRVYSMQQEGQKLQVCDVLPMSGPVRHFTTHGNKIIAGTTSPQTTFLNCKRPDVLLAGFDNRTLLHTFELVLSKDGKDNNNNEQQQYELVGTAPIETGVFCLECD